MSTAEPSKYENYLHREKMIQIMGVGHIGVLLAQQGKLWILLSPLQTHFA